MKRLMKKSNNFNVVYAGEEMPKQITKSIFLAGPTPRSNNIESWRKEAIELLKLNNYDGTVFIPEPRNGDKYPDYTDQIEWEQKMLDACDCILFWIPREKNENFEMIGLTTNIEWGKYQESAKVVVGFPNEAESIRYIQYECNKLGIHVNNTLEDTILNAIGFVGNGALRENGECYVPLVIWNTDMFQKWYAEQKRVGNILEFARLNYIFKMPKAKKVFLWILYVKVFIKDENRYKENEFVVSRTDISSVVIYKKDNNDILNSDIVLVEEFRSPARNERCKVLEVPGGSSIADNVDPLETIVDEIKEETGLYFDKNRIVFEQDRQLMATLSSHKCYLYSVEITDKEFENIKQLEGTVNGVEDDSERTYLRILKVKDLLNNNLLDWSNIGYILNVIYKN